MHNCSLKEIFDIEWRLKFSSENKSEAQIKSVIFDEAKIKSITRQFEPKVSECQRKFKEGVQNIQEPRQEKKE